MFIDQKFKFMLILSFIINLILSYIIFFNNTTQDQIRYETSHDTMYIDLKGEVNSPGVYEINENERLFTLIEKAGGFTSNADLFKVNGSLLLDDEMIIIIPNKNNIEHLNSANHYISINYSTIDELQTLNGIGEAKARAIINYRNENGPFKQLEEIIQVTGIGEATFNKIKDDIIL